jgi:capsid portal protein
VKPLQDRLMELNDWLGQTVVRFQAYALGAIDHAQ